MLVVQRILCACKVVKRVISVFLYLDIIAVPDLRNISVAVICPGVRLVGVCVVLANKRFKTESPG